jgi:hypothetical protein
MLKTVKYTVLKKTESGHKIFLTIKFSYYIRENMFLLDLDALFCITCNLNYTLLFFKYYHL